MTISTTLNKLKWQQGIRRNQHNFDTGVRKKFCSTSGLYRELAADIGEKFIHRQHLIAKNLSGRLHS